MSEDKFLSDTKTVLEFISYYCEKKHTNQNKDTLALFYKDKMLQNIDFILCDECKETFLYTYQRLQNCPHEQKPRCRNCPHPCYEKPKWKKLSVIMRYTGIKKGLLKIKKIFKA